ncbi:MAG: DUF4290 domain-containing protein [Chitinophagales bacterium]|nr:DUF4290 domain-containing protein [Bacteroidota bacterium]MCB9227076.1 DUF4290 domain-containing protein [Chitinophagales bacterium]
MDYNTQRGQIQLKEYGRHIQNLVEHAITIKDDKKRQGVAEEIINIMASLNPHLKNVDDFNHLLWDHLFIMSDFKLDVNSPFPIPEREEVFAKPERFSYPKKNTKFKHYGKNIQTMINKAIEMEDGEIKHGFTKCIANYMKIVHNNWNSETVTDETIINDLEIISNDQLSLSDEVTLKNVQSSKKKFNNNNNRNGRNNKNKNYRNNRSRKRN